LRKSLHDQVLPRYCRGHTFALNVARSAGG
jgi:hypothetical protein